ncbi:MAG TPA: type I 3-dehydroquinate dehydratase [Methanospirillum sp.]|uniref:type I 3-dehydroquinate dehydratase n=1 Tax=Methanospirillum sp. TaxID=45200 RepID=UPI002B7C0E0E|nr:type I 3-dehydroquinate dehydratase [Methanospirillum sp.]HOJ96500.1 type I 3-dehydroquinate dehydratase [Methanospirillum sp.]HOL41625.1 type I 3-dehydroquinate dehydratase [Methanospirillum sp.]HPP77770.1 type I 3-dehydroquinate dehydratase [Methanospirillum sp.]
MASHALKADPNRLIQIIASLSSTREIVSPQVTEADAVEIRLDLITESVSDALQVLRQTFQGQIILTVRSSDEGGAYAGGSSGLWSRIEPYIEFGDIIDLEVRFKEHAPMVRRYNKQIIASCHQNRMPSDDEMKDLIEELHSFGDMVKIAVQPGSKEDLLRLLKITAECPYPVIMSVTGTVFRYARPLLCLFGSRYTYCYIHSETSPGQYSLREMQLLAHLLSPGFVDPWFEGRPVRSGDASGYYERAEHYRKLLEL